MRETSTRYANMLELKPWDMNNLLNEYWFLSKIKKKLGGGAQDRDFKLCLACSQRGHRCTGLRLPHPATPCSLTCQTRTCIYCKGSVSL